MEKPEIRREKIISPSPDNSDIKDDSDGAKVCAEGKNVRRRKVASSRLEPKHFEGMCELHNPALMGVRVWDESRRNAMGAKRLLETKSAKTKALEYDQTIAKKKKLPSSRELKLTNLYASAKTLKFKLAQQQSASINDPIVQKDSKDKVKPRSAGYRSSTKKVVQKDQKLINEQESESSVEKADDANSSEVGRSNYILQVEFTSTPEITPHTLSEVPSFPLENCNNEDTSVSNKKKDIWNEIKDTGVVKKTLKSSLKSTKTEKRVGDEPSFKENTELGEFENSDRNTSYIYQYSLDLADLESEDSDEETCCFDDATDVTVCETVEMEDKITQSADEENERETSLEVDIPQPPVKDRAAVGKISASATSPTTGPEETEEYPGRWQQLVNAFTRARICRVTLCAGWLVWAAWIMRLIGFAHVFGDVHIMKALETWGLLEVVGFVEVLGLLEVFWLLRGAHRRVHSASAGTSTLDALPSKAASAPTATARTVFSDVPTTTTWPDIQTAAAKSSSITDSVASDYATADASTTGVSPLPSTIRPELIVSFPTDNDVTIMKTSPSV